MTGQNYGPNGKATTPSEQTESTAKPDILTEDFSRFLQPGPNGRTSPALQGAIAMSLLGIEDRTIRLLKDQSADATMRFHAQTAHALLSRWFPGGRPCEIQHEVAIEQFRAVLIFKYFFEHLTKETPELNLPAGYNLVSEVNQFKITHRELNTGIRYELETDRMAPQILPGTKVFLVKRDAQWSKVNDVVYINCLGHFEEEITGRIVGSGKQTIRLRPDNNKWPAMVIRRKDILSLYSVSCILFKPVL